MPDIGFLSIMVFNINLKLYKYNYFASKIQSTWRSFKTRKIIKNIFIKLPCEIKSIVLKHLRFDWNVQQFYIPSVIKIYNNRNYTLIKQRDNLIKNILNDNDYYDTFIDFNNIPSIKFFNKLIKTNNKYLSNFI